MFLVLILLGTISDSGAFARETSSDFHMYMKELCNSSFFDISTGGQKIATYDEKLQTLNGYQNHLVFHQHNCTIILKDGSVVDGQNFTITILSYENDVLREHSEIFTVTIPVPVTFIPLMTKNGLEDYTRNITRLDEEEKTVPGWKRKSTKKSRNTADPESNNPDTGPSPNDDLLGRKKQKCVTIDYMRRLVLGVCKIGRNVESAAEMTFNTGDPEPDIS